MRSERTLCKRMSKDDGRTDSGSQDIQELSSSSACETRMGDINISCTLSRETTSLYDTVFSLWKNRTPFGSVLLETIKITERPCSFVFVVVYDVVFAPFVTRITISFVSCLLSSRHCRISFQHAKVVQEATTTADGETHLDSECCCCARICICI
jgi:hypothetical protein